MDETDSPQTPSELLLILAAIADAGIPIQTIAPKFTGRFNKGVDYVGDVEQFEKEFAEDLAVIAFAVKRYGLPASLKLSVHSGSDKFSIYGAIRRSLRKFDAGVHVKTAGTTWLEELIGLAEAGPEGLAMAKEIYAQALDHMEELCAPYASVIDVEPEAACPRPRRYSSGARSSIRGRCGTTRRIRCSIRIYGSCCMWGIRLRRRWAIVIPECWMRARNRSRAM